MTGTSSHTLAAEQPSARNLSIRSRGVVRLIGAGLASVALVAALAPGQAGPSAAAVAPAESSAAVAGPSSSGSVFEVMPDDPTAVVLGGDEFPVHGDGVGDDTASLQAAIDEASRRGSANGWGNIVAPAREFGTGDGGGAVFVPEGTYRISQSLDLHDSVRLIGFGAQRPTIFLGPDTPGFQEGTESYMIIARRRPYQDDGPPLTMGYNDTFGTGLMNVDLSIGDGNPAAVGIRFGGAQMFLMQDVDIDVGEGYAGIDHNVHMMQRVNIRGGDVGMLSYADAWAKTVLDSSFVGQREAAIKMQNDAKLTIMRTRFADSPLGIEAAWPNQWQHLYVQDSVFEDISGPAIRLNDSESIPGLDEPELREAQNQLNVVNTGLTNTEGLLTLAPSGRTWAGPGSSYLVDDATLGLRVHDALGEDESRTDGVVVSAHRAPSRSFDRLFVSDIPLPPSTDDWVNIRDYAAEHGQTVGSGTEDDHAIFQQAIDEHDTIYVPMGQYWLTDTLELRPDTNLIALHPRQTWLMIPDQHPDFSDPDNPKALLETPPGGHNFVRGFGLDTAKTNPGSVHVRWQAGQHSHLTDIVTPFVKYFPEETEPGEPGLGSGDPGYEYRGDNKYTIWVDGGGGVFSNIWSMTGWADNGLLVENTSIPSRVYKISVEHHQHREVVLRNVENWEFYALQTEDHIYGWRSTAVEMDDVSNILFGHTDFFRVATVKGTHPHAMSIQDSADVTIRGTRGYRPPDLPNARWGATITDAATGNSVPDLETAYIGIGIDDEPLPAGTHVALDSPTAAAMPGESLSTALTLRNDGPGVIRDLDIDVETPEGWQGDATFEATSLPPGKTAQATVDIKVPADGEKFTSHNVTLTLTHRRGNDRTTTTQHLEVKVGGENLALSATAEASSVSGSNVAANAINGVTTGARWISAGDDPEPTLTLNLDAPADLRVLRLYSGYADEPRFVVGGMSVEALVGEEWTQIARLEDNTDNPAELDLTNAPGNIQHVRLVFTEPSNTDDIARVYEVELYGTRSTEAQG